MSYNPAETGRLTTVTPSVVSVDDGTTSGPVQLCPADPSRVAIFLVPFSPGAIGIGEISASPFPEDLIGLPAGTEYAGWDLEYWNGAGGFLKLLYADYGPLIQMAWYGLCGAGLTIDVRVIEVADNPNAKCNDEQSTLAQRDGKLRQWGGDVQSGPVAAPAGAIDFPGAIISDDDYPGLSGWYGSAGQGN